MVKWISFALQLFALKKTFTQSTSALDYVQRTAQTARSYFLFTVGCTVASLFLLISLVVAIIAVGLQIENSGAISFTGLMISAVLFLAISVFFYIISTIALVIQKQRLIETQRLAEQARASESGLGQLIEEILKQILVNLSKPSGPASAADKKAENNS
jgi:hypothetical protein